MRIRQFVIVARNLEKVVGDLTAVLGIEVAFNDPSVREFGLQNAVMPVGDTFLEVVSPVVPDATAQRYLERRRGDGGYMLIIQCDDLDRDRERLGSIGVRTVWKADLATIRGTHLHPKDTGGTLLSLDDATPPESWHWAGPAWKEHVRRSVVDSITAAELQASDPAGLARRWAAILDRPVRESSQGVFEIPLEQRPYSLRRRRGRPGRRSRRLRRTGDRPGRDHTRSPRSRRAIGEGEVTVAGVRIGLA
jgi:Glyoxalase-like domain